MSQDTNKVTLTGAIDSEVDIKFLDNGMAIAEFIVKSIGWKDKERFVLVKCFKERAEDASANGRIGARVAIEGELDGRAVPHKVTGKLMVFMTVIANKLSIEAVEGMGSEPNFDDSEEVPF